MRLTPPSPQTPEQIEENYKRRRRVLENVDKFMEENNADSDAK